MKTLLLFRHAKSAWPEGVDDHERPLAPRGIKAAPKMAAYMRDSGIRPDTVIVSTARRTQETWELMASRFPSASVIDNRRIYEASAGAILDVIREQRRDIGSLMLVGHNPGLEDLARYLIASGKGDAEAQPQEKFPTAALAVLTLPINDWADIKPASAILECFVTPKMLG